MTDLGIYTEVREKGKLSPGEAQACLFGPPDQGLGLIPGDVKSVPLESD